jgi:hypothetical protein
LGIGEFLDCMSLPSSSENCGMISGVNLARYTW